MKNQRLTAAFLTVLTIAGAVSISLALFTDGILIRNTGRILAVKLFDNCDQVNGWVVYSAKGVGKAGNNTIEVDTTDKVEGSASLKMTFAATEPNWGGYFGKTGSWDFSQTPVLRIRFKANNELPANFRFFIRDISGAGSVYNILDKINTTGEWLTIDIDLRLPSSGEMFPNLSHISWIEFSCWDIVISEPKSFNLDFMEMIVGETIPLAAKITPGDAWTEVGLPVSFKVDVKGGVAPYSYEWYVNGTLQTETSNTFTFIPNTAGNYTINCTITDSVENSTYVTATLEAEVITPPPPAPQSIDVFKSEIRGVFLHNWMLRNPNWTRIAETCLHYGINTIVIEITTTELWDSSAGKVKDYPALRTAIDIFHSYGFRVHVLAVIGFSSIPGMTAVHSDGTTANWLCLNKNATRQAWKAMMESLVANYSIDGFMFDYIRYDSTDMCFCNECKAKFIADTGLTDVNWPSDCIAGGRYFWNFIQWRADSVTEFVGDAVQWMKAIKPDLTISAAVFTAFSHCGNYWVLEIAQHTADWVDKGYLDFVCPMIYTANAQGAASNLLDSLDFYVGGREGKVPMVPFISIYTSNQQPMNIEDFVSVVSALKTNGADGYIIWRYGGAGFEKDPFTPKFIDIRPYLASLIDNGLMQPVWAIQNLTISFNSTHAIISWDTTVPTNSTVEYADGKIFYGRLRYGDFGRPFYYKDIEYNSTGIIRIQNETLSTSHLFIIPLTDLAQFRVQSTDERGVTITSKPISVSKA